MPCLLAGLNFQPEPPEGFNYVARDPSPLAARCEELGGCELQRLTQCPTVIGSITSKPLPALHVTLRTDCCCRASPGARVMLGGRAPMSIDEVNFLEMRRRKKGEKLQVHIEDV